MASLLAIGKDTQAITVYYENCHSFKTFPSTLLCTIQYWCIEDEGWFQQITYYKSGTLRIFRFRVESVSKLPIDEY